MLLVVEVDCRDRAGNGVITLVASKRPPSPTSMTPTSTPERRNSSKAAAVVASKNVGCTLKTPEARRRSAQLNTSSTVDSSSGRFNGTIVDDESLGEVAQMGRRVSAGPDPCGPQRRVRHGGDRTLPVRACDVQRPERALRMPERLAEQRDVVEAQLDAERLERE